MNIKIALTDDHPMVLRGIQSLLADTKEVTFVGVYATANETFKHIEKDQPDILLLDINLPDMNGIDVTEGHSTKIIESNLR